MNKPTNVLNDENVEQKLPGVANIACEFAEVRGIKEEIINIECENYYEDAETQLRKQSTIDALAKFLIVIKGDDGEKYRINTETGKAYICKGQDKNKVNKVVENFIAMIEENGVKLKEFKEIIADGRSIEIGTDNTIDEAKLKEVLKVYKQEQQGEQDR